MSENSAVTRTAADPPPVDGSSAGHGLRRDAVGAHHLVFFVVAAAAPLTVSAGFLPLGFLFGGVLLPAGFVIAGLAYGVFSVGFTALSRHIPDAGAFAAYVRAGLGGRAGGAAAFVAWLGYTLGQIGFAAAAGYFLSVLLNVLGIGLPWGVCSTVLAVLVVAVSYAKINLGAAGAAVLLLSEVAVLAVFVVAVWVRGGPEGVPLDSFDPATWDVSALGAMLVFTFVVYIGFEQTAVYSEEARDSRRTVPRATYLAVGILTVIYLLVSWTILTAVGPSRLLGALSGDPSQLVFDLNTDFVGLGMTGVMQVLVITSFVAGVLALQNAGSRYLFSMARQGMLPAALARTAASGSPRPAVLVQGGIVVAAVIGFGLSSLDPYTQVVIWTNTPTLFAVLALQIATSVAVIRWFTRRPAGETVWVRRIAPAVSVVILGAVLVLGIVNMGLLTSLGGVGNVLLLLPLIVAVVAGAIVGGRASTAERPAATTEGTA